MSPFLPAITPARARATPFTSAAGAEAWDAWFRWRDAGGLRDVTIDATWNRVAEALARAGGRDSGDGECYRRAFSQFRLLPDPLLLRRLGTGTPAGHASELAAVVNVAACVSSPATPHAALDEACVAATARLAVRMLDDARAALAEPPAYRPVLTLGIVGLGDALAMLGLCYDSDAARECAAQLGRLVAVAVFEASVELAELRGPEPGQDAGSAPAAAPHALVERARRAGLRGNPRIVAQSQRELALFANAVSDALEPVSDDGHVHRIDSPQGERRVAAAGPALTLRREREAGGAVVPPIDTSRDVSAEARRRMYDAFASGIAAGAPRATAPTG